MKFIVDAQLPPALAEYLRGKGHQAIALREVELRHAKDRTIWEYARQEGYIVVSKDQDFAILAAIRTDPEPRVLWVRCGNLVNRLLLARFDQRFPEAVLHFEAGARIVELR